LRIALAAGGVSLLVAFAPVLWHMAVPAPAPAAPQGTPWQVDHPAPGRTQVFGLDLPGSTLGQARTRWGEDLAVALIDDRGAGTLALEAYLERFDAGGVGGRLLLTFEVDPGAAARWRDRLPSAPTSSGAWRHRLDGAALAEAAGAPLAGVSFVPAARLDAAAVSARFGAPDRRVAEGAQRQHWLYPALGLAVMLDDEGRDLLQYVAPADFERRLVAPLQAR
jgi:hypothetical protein